MSHPTNDPRPIDPESLSPLPIADSGGTGGPVRVCIASSDLVGPVRNGGVGTAFTALGVALAEAGHEVTLLYVGGDFCENGRMADWVEHYRRQNIDFVPLPSLKEPRIDAPWHVVKANETYEWLKANDRFDVVHFSEWMGNGYYSLLAKHEGLRFENTVFCVTPHGPSFWHKLNNAEFVHRPDDVELDYMERRSIALADVVAAPSRYVVRWMLEHRWSLPERTYIQQYVIPDAVRDHGSEEPAAPCSIRELVFFGRLEVRKGLILFCDALDRLVRANGDGMRDVSVTFLGKIATVHGQPADRYIQHRAEKWPFEPKVLTTLDQAGVMRYLREPNRLAVIPSLADNLPNTVLECLGGRVPFIAADSGGIPEMIAAADHEQILFETDPAALAGCLARVLTDGIRPAGFAVDVRENERAWIAWHEGLMRQEARERPRPAKPPRPLVSLCMPHHDRPHYLRQALESVRALDYPNYEVVLVDDGSVEPETLEYLRQLETEFGHRGWQLIRQPNRFPGAARNNAARHARGDYLLFMDDDNYAKPEELCTFVDVACHTGADILTCFSDIVTTSGPIVPRQRPEARWLCLGGPASAGLFRNVFGDTNALVRREVFLELGGFHEVHGVGLEDWELWARASLEGYRVLVVPEPLFTYRLSGDGVNTRTPIHANMMQILNPYFEAVPETLHELVRVAQGLKLENDDLHTAVEQLRDSAGDRNEQAALLGAAKALARMGEARTACTVYAAGMRLAQERRDGPAALQSLLGSAEMFARLGECEMARRSLEAAAGVATQLGEQDTVKQVQSSIARLAMKQALRVPTAMEEAR